MAQGDSKKFSDYDLKSGKAAYNNSTNTFSWILITDTFASVDANSVDPVIGDYTAATIGGNYAGKTALTSVTWVRAAAISTLDYDNITFAANASNPIDAKCLLVINDTSATDDALRVTDLTTDGTTAVDLTQGFTLTVNASGAVTVTTNA
jgi:hypothetical protein